MNKETKQKMTTSVYGTRIYLFFLTIINFIWLYCMEVKINLFSLISACIVFLILFLLYRREGKEYVLNIVQSNLFFSLFFLVFPFSFLALIAAVAKDFFLKSFVLWCSWGARLKEARAVRRERGPRWEPWEFTISLGSPMQTACIKTIVFLFINQAVDQVRMFVF